MLRSSFLHLQPVTPVKIIRRKQFLRAHCTRERVSKFFDYRGSFDLSTSDTNFSRTQFYNRITIGKLELSTLHVIILGDT